MTKEQFKNLQVGDLVTPQMNSIETGIIFKIVEICPYEYIEKIGVICHCNDVVIEPIDTDYNIHKPKNRDGEQTLLPGNKRRFKYQALK